MFSLFFIKVTHFFREKRSFKIGKIKFFPKTLSRRHILLWENTKKCITFCFFITFFFMWNLIRIKNGKKRACLLNCHVKHVKNWFAYRRKLLRPKPSSENQEIINEQSTYSGYVNINVNTFENFPSSNKMVQNQCLYEIYPISNNNFCSPQNFITPEYKFYQENSSNSITWVAIPFRNPITTYQGPIRTLMPVTWDSIWENWILSRGRSNKCSY